MCVLGKENMMPLLFSCLFVLLQLSGNLALVVTPGDVAVLEGRSVTVPCHYDPQYIHHVKYWCQGRMKDFCTTLARSHETGDAPTAENRVSIFDDPTQLVFTVTMMDLTEGDSGWYWCGVEVRGMWHADDAAALHISVVHGMSVLNSRVHGEEGDSIDVRCQYSLRHRESEKRWCRSGDWGSCVKTDSNGTFRNEAVEIQDDQWETFTVTLKNAQRRDTGWYWCASGEQQVAVHVNVTPRATTTPSLVTDLTTLVTDVMESSDPTTCTEAVAPPARGFVQQPHNAWMPPLVICLALLLLLMGILATQKLWRYYKRSRAAKELEELESRLTVCPVREADWKNTTIVFLNTSTQQLQVLGKDKHNF
ncbi:polymeric immunoglobulin receptor [Alosa sapidissima]|uniref:polymeric immunoglobulin receptor n=1 Tax=Alosa sapidissima TaxID=34773 RepID=UPI001C09B66D|nr:polymeric immunoglobulin receptor [Alosa sapidissima]